MSPRKESQKTTPATPRATRQTVLTGRVVKTPLTPSQTPDKDTSKKKYTKLLATAAPPSSPSPNNNNRVGSNNSADSSKYGPCPKCTTGRRIRSRFKPHGESPYKGKFRFVCSNRFRNPPGTDCDYCEVLTRDPLEDPAYFQAEARAQVQEKNKNLKKTTKDKVQPGIMAGQQGKGKGQDLGQGQGQDKNLMLGSKKVEGAKTGGIGFDDDGDDDMIIQHWGYAPAAMMAPPDSESTDTDKVIGKATPKSMPKATGKAIGKTTTRATPKTTAKATPKATTTGKTTGTGKTTATPKANSKKPAQQKKPQPAQPHQQLGCPQCLKGKLVQKIKDTFRWRERVLVCEKTLVGQEWVGGCGYRLELENGPSSDNDNDNTNNVNKNNNDDDDDDDDDDGGVEIVSVGKATPKAPGETPRAWRVMKADEDSTGKKKKDIDEWSEEAMRRAWENPLTSAVPAGTAERLGKGKVVVDLTEDGDDEEEEEEEGKKSASSSQTVRARPNLDLMVGGKPVLFVNDDDDERPSARAKASAAVPVFEEISSDDEVELIKMVDRAGDKFEDLNEDDELELIELVDKASAPVPRK